jgi:peptidoglycan/LPS O-acetylase OafA/YrhL
MSLKTVGYPAVSAHAPTRERSGTSYRREIDGLRALAVLAVILFHAGDRAFSGGFVGVDVFFVVSGFLITALIIAETRVGTFTLAGFYERRARRILPALFLVMFACLPFVWLWMLPGDARDFSESMLAVCAFASNILFWRQSGYFGSATDLKPLAHTWSLAVEEQYYLLYPLFLLLVCRLSKRRMAGVLLAAAAISLATAQWGSRFHPQAAFYLLPTRGWELLLGAFAALYPPGKDTAGAAAARSAGLAQQAAGLGGLLLIACAIFSFDENTPYPSVYTLVPTVGTVLVILFASPLTVAGRLLGSSALVGLGLISYSAYLWHQPLFAFARHRSDSEPSEAWLLALSLAAIGLAYLSWKYVEQPFRNRMSINRPLFLKWAGLATGILVVLGLVGYASKGFSYRYAPADRYLVELDVYAARDYVPARFTALTLRQFDASDKKKVLIVGDSYAQDLVNALYESGLTARIQVSTYLIPAACGNLFVKEDVTAKIVPADRGRCAQTGWYDNDRLRHLMRAADAIWIVSSWLPWQADLLPESIARIDSAFGPKALVFGDKDFGTFTVKDLLRLPARDRVQFKNPMSDQHLKVNKLMSSLLPHDVFLDVSHILCGDGTACPLFTSDGKLISYDGGHLTPDGAKYYGQKLAETPTMRHFLGLADRDARSGGVNF